MWINYNGKDVYILPYRIDNNNCIEYKYYSDVRRDWIRLDSLDKICEDYTVTVLPPVNNH